MLSLIACKDSKINEIKTQPSKVNFSEMQQNSEVKPDTFVNDLEKIFSATQNEDLESYLVKLKRENGKKILILTVPSKNKLDKDWSIENGFTNSGIIITVSESLKEVGIGIAKDTEKSLSEMNREKIIENIIIPEFDNGKYYEGIKNGIEEILKNWK